MKKEDFKKYLEGLQRIQDRSMRLYENMICLLNYENDWYHVVRILLETIYNKEQLDLMDWFVSENDFGRKGFAIYDENRNPTCRTVEELWEYLEKLKN